MSGGRTGRPGALSRPARHPGERRRGIALLLVLWMLALLSVLALSFSGTARTQGRIARNLYENSKARWLADAGVRLGMRRLWLNQAGQEMAGGGTLFCRFGSGSLAITVQNVSGLIDLNAAPPETLASLFTAAGLERPDAHRLAAAVADFRDRDGRRRPDGAEADDYDAAGLPHGPKNDAFRAIEELEQVMGMPPELIERIRMSVTVHSGRPHADLRLAPPLVRLAYGASSEYSPAEGHPLSDGGERTVRISATAVTAANARFSRDAVLAIGAAPRADYRVLSWGRIMDRELRFPEGQQLPPC